MRTLFNNSFYSQFQAPNASEIIDALENEEQHIVQLSWANLCNVKTLGLHSKKYLPLIQPSLEIFFSDLNLPQVKYYMWDPWMNHYSRGGFQELHDHPKHEFVCVFFPNVGEDFGKFYFYDRNHIQVSNTWKDLTNFSERWIPDVKPGDIMFFPGHILHAVSPHNSDVVRKSFSANFNLILD